MNIMLLIMVCLGLFGKGYVITGIIASILAFVLVYMVFNGDKFPKVPNWVIMLILGPGGGLSEEVAIFKDRERQ